MMLVRCPAPGTGVDARITWLGFERFRASFVWD
jgi:hypothetical protein